MRQLIFASLQVKDLQASKKFYQEILGFEIQHENPQACIFKYDAGQASFAIRTPIVPIDNKELGVGVSIWFSINEKLEFLRETIKSKGISIVGEIMQTPFGKTFYVKDLDGYQLTFLESNN